jgi:hypothetical protein
LVNSALPFNLHIHVALQVGNALRILPPNCAGSLPIVDDLIIIWVTDRTRVIPTSINFQSKIALLRLPTHKAIDPKNIF